jgi:hypothetical protein
VYIMSNDNCTSKVQTAFAPTPANQSPLVARFLNNLVASRTIDQVQHDVGVQEIDHSVMPRFLSSSPRAFECLNTASVQWRLRGALGTVAFVPVAFLGPRTGVLVEASWSILSVAVVMWRFRLRSSILGKNTLTSPSRVAQA